MVIFAADTVNSPKPLNDTHGVPMDVIIDKIVTVLQVLTFGNTVGGNQNVEFVLASRHQDRFSFRDRGEAGQHRIEVGTELRNGRFSVHGAGDLRCFQAKFCFGIFAYIFVKIIGSIGKGSEDNDLPVAEIDGMLDLLLNQVE